MLFPSTVEKEGKNELTGLDNIKGRDIRIICEKNKCGIALRTVKTRFTFGEGYTIEDDVFNVGKNIGIIEGRYKFVTENDDVVKLGNNEIDAKQFLRDNEDVCKLISTAISKHLLLNESEYSTGVEFGILNED